MRDSMIVQDSVEQSQVISAVNESPLKCALSGNQKYTPAVSSWWCWGEKYVVGHQRCVDVGEYEYGNGSLVSDYDYHFRIAKLYTGLYLSREDYVRFDYWLEGDYYNDTSYTGESVVDPVGNNFSTSGYIETYSGDGVFSGTGTFFCWKTPYNRTPDFDDHSLLAGSLPEGTNGGPWVDDATGYFTKTSDTSEKIGRAHV